MKLFQTILISGLCLSSLHFFWVVLVGLGFAQPLLDFIFRLHMLNSPFLVQPFNSFFAIGLLSITFLVGCFYGVVFYLIKSRFNL